jgi:DNA adenine methylase
MDNLPIDYPIAGLPDYQIRPLLKWAGGKRQLLPELRRFYPESFGCYIEPFLGSGAVFFDLHGSGRLKGHDVVLIDSNADLIGCYQMVRDAPDEVGRLLEGLAAGHAQGGNAYYYDVRDGRFNPMRKALRHSDGSIPYTPELAAMLIYLNRTGYNGLFRLNRRGGFNVPAGRYARPTICNRAHVSAVAQALADSRARLVCASFDAAMDVAAAGDFLYIDPPYSPISRTANFTSYTADRFGTDSQQRLQQMVIQLARRGSHLLVSNSASAEITGLYRRDHRARAAGLRAAKVHARRAINSNGARRGPVFEYLVTNIAAASYAPESQTS